MQRIDQRPALHLAARFGEQAQRRRDHSGCGYRLIDAKARPGAVGKDREIVIGKTENFAQGTDDFVGIARIGHDRAERCQPGVGRVIALHVAFRLDRRRHPNATQRRGHHAQPKFSRTQYRHVTPGTCAQLFMAGCLDPGRQGLGFANGFLIILFVAFPEQTSVK